MDFSSLLGGLGGGGGGSKNASAASSSSINSGGTDLAPLIPWVIGGFAAVVGVLLLAIVIRK